MLCISKRKIARTKIPGILRIPRGKYRVLYANIMREIFLMVYDTGLFNIERFVFLPLPAVALVAGFTFS